MEQQTKAARNRFAPLFGVFLALVALFCCAPSIAWAATNKSVPSVLVVDSNVGDLERCRVSWLGESSELVAEDGTWQLLSAPAPVWWTSAEGCPRTFVLGNTATNALQQTAESNASEALTCERLVWALNQIGASGAEPKCFVVGMGPAGLVVREYAEDLGTAKQSSRADIVGMALCGSPNNGYSVAATYPDSQLWSSLAQAIGKSAEQVAPGGNYIAALNAGTFPRVSKSLNLMGSVGDLGFGMTDGAAVLNDLTLASSVTSQVQQVQVNATASQAINLTGAWQPFTSKINYPQTTVDSKLAERLSALDSYATSPEVLKSTQEFYQLWFSQGVPVTHSSHVLLLDLSGSMNEAIDEHSDKLTASKTAAKEYLHAMRACAALPQSAPMDLSVIGFAEETATIARTYDNAAIDAIDTMTANYETNIGAALEEALNALSTSPVCADRHILLLSDGASTRGISEQEILSGPVEYAKKNGVVIDAVGFGDVGESNASFLQQVTAATGGSYYLANDTYSLRVNFLKSYYSSLGLELVDEELASGANKSEVLGSVDNRTVALEIGVVAENTAPTVRLLCDNKPLDESLYKAETNGSLVTVQCLNPSPGEYSLELSQGSGAMHVFAVRQLGISEVKNVQGEQKDYSLYLLIAAGVATLVGVALVTIHTMRKR